MGEKRLQKQHAIKQVIIIKKKSQILKSHIRNFFKRQKALNVRSLRILPRSRARKEQREFERRDIRNLK